MLFTAVKAPEGYEAHRSWNHSQRQWDVNARKLGDRFWTHLGFAGHAFLLESEVDLRSEELVRRSVEAGRVWRNDETA